MEKISAIEREIFDELRKYKVTLISVPQENYFELLAGFFSILFKFSERVCYVNLGYPFDKLLKNFSQNKVKTNNLFFINFRSEGKSKKRNCEFLPLSSNLEDLSVSLIKNFQLGKYEYLIFDSISELLEQEEIKVIIKFIRAVTKYFKPFETSIILLYKKDSKEYFFKKISEFADKIIVI